LQRFITRHYKYYILQLFAAIKYFEFCWRTSKQSYHRLAFKLTTRFEDWVNSGAIYCETLPLILLAEEEALTTDDLQCKKPIAKADKN